MSEVLAESPTEDTAVDGYAWIVDLDVAHDESGVGRNSAGATGGVPELVERLRAGDAYDGPTDGYEVEYFRLDDERGQPLFEGRIVGSYYAFEPLQDFGFSNGADEILYLRGGGWVRS